MRRLRKSSISGNNMFLAHGGATSGHMCGEVCSGMRNIREIHILSAKAAIEAGADIVMTAYNTIDGVLCVASKEILTDLLRDELGFEGVVMTDGLRQIIGAAWILTIRHGIL